MSLSLYSATVPVLTRALDNLSAIVAKGAEYAQAQQLAPASVIEARLAPDMMTFAGQIQRASDSAKGAVARLAGIDNPGYADDETTFEQLQARIARTRAFVAGVDAAQFEGSAERTIVISPTAFKHPFRGDEYLLSFVLPNVFFHVTTAYAILRNMGVQIGKMDYLGSFE